MSYYNWLGKIKCETFFSKNKYCADYIAIKRTIATYGVDEFENKLELIDLIDFLIDNKSLTNDMILTYVYKNIMIFQLKLKGHELFESSSHRGHKLIMEDRHLIHTDYENSLQICAIFDGHSGSECVNYLRANYIKELYDNKYFQLYLNDVNPENMIEGLKNVTITLDTYFVKNRITGGSTAIVVVVTQNNIYLSNVGDSRAIVIFDDYTYLTTTDQKPLLYEDRIKKAGGHVKGNRVDGKLAVGNAFGDVHFKSNENLELSEQKVVGNSDITIIENTFNVLGIALGCDGIYDVYENEELVGDIINATKVKTKNYNNVTESILGMTLLKKSTDNLTICVSLKKNKKIYGYNKKENLFTPESFHFLRLIPEIIEDTQRYTKSQIKKQQLNDLLKSKKHDHATQETNKKISKDKINDDSDVQQDMLDKILIKYEQIEKNIKSITISDDVVEFPIVSDKVQQKFNSNKIKFSFQDDKKKHKRRTHT